ncbi:IS5 family transposase [Embleya sp. NPDC008237]|uniref:IS5 family transposase n=1 Tax=Embleya sp. NPDC008237 TaxID=3363978 RepID=UPI0036EC87C2
MSARPTAFTRRDQLNAIRWRTRTGAPWRDIPERYGPWESAYSLFRRRRRDGTRARVLEQLQARADARGLHDRAGASARGRCPQKGDLQREPPGGVVDEPSDHALGRSRGGPTTKIHLVCEQGRRPPALLITAGQRGDSPRFANLPDAIRIPRIGPGRPRTRPGRVRDDKAYSSRANRALLRRRGIACTIPEPADQIRNRRKHRHHRRHRRMAVTKTCFQTDPGAGRGTRPGVHGPRRRAVTSCHALPIGVVGAQDSIVARSDSLRRTQNSLPSGSARIAQPEPSGLR